MLECECGTIAVPLGDKVPRGWTWKESESKYLCPLCTMVEREKRRREAAAH